MGEPCVFDLVEELREGVEKAQQHRDSEASQARAVTGGEESGKDDAASVFSSDGEGGTSDLESDEEASTTSTTPTPTATTAKTSPNHLASLGGKAASAASAAAGGATVVFNALIRTHHVTSRKKVGKVKKAAQHELRYLLIRSGGSPGLMYAEGEEGALREWVAGVAVSVDFCCFLLEKAERGRGKGRGRGEGRERSGSDGREEVAESTEECMLISNRFYRPSATKTTTSPGLQLLCPSPGLFRHQHQHRHRNPHRQLTSTMRAMIRRRNLRLRQKTQRGMKRWTVWRTLQRRLKGGVS